MTSIKDLRIIDAGTRNEKVELNAATPGIEDAIRHACRNDWVALERMDKLVLIAALMYFQTDKNPIYGTSKTTPKSTIIEKLLEQTGIWLKGTKSSDIVPQFTTTPRKRISVNRTTPNATDGDWTAVIKIDGLGDTTRIGRNKSDAMKQARRLIRNAARTIREAASVDHNAETRTSTITF